LNQNDLSIVIQALLDIKKSESNINAQIKQLKVDALKLKLEIDNKNLKEYQSSVNAINKESIESIKAESKAHTEAHEKKVTQLKEEAQLVAQNTKESSKILSDKYKAEILELDKVALSSKMSIWLKDNSKAAAGFGDEIRQLQIQLENVDTRADYTKINKDFNNIKLRAKEAGEATKTLGDQLVDNAKKFAQWFTVGGLIAGTVREFRQMVSVVRELDTAMVEMKKVTDETDATYTRFFNNAATRAKQLGAELDEVIRASADFARLGYSIEDSEKLSDIAILYKNVGDGISSVDAASSSIISTMKAFNISVEDSMHIVDAFNKVGNEYSISSKGIGDALLRSASSLSAANNTLEESIGIIVAGYDVIQDADVLGTALKTISMRLRNTAGELEALNEDADGAAESITKLQTQILNLTHGKVDIMLDDSTFKSTYQILTEISNEWDSLSDKAQADITRLVAGTRQGNVFDALMQGMTEGAKATEAAINSQNSALEENEKYLDSINGKIALYQTAFQKLSSTTIDSNLVKGVVDTGTAALTIIEKLISSLGTLPILIAAITTAISVKNNTGKVNMPTTWKVISNTTKWKSHAHHMGCVPLNCLEMAKAA
jgi:TP901 family phage tail tape measure protein